MLYALSQNKTSHKIKLWFKCIKFILQTLKTFLYYAWNILLIIYFLFQMFLCKILYLLVLVLILVPLIISLPHHDLHKRSSFFDIECKGQFNKSIFFRLDRICEDCYALFREPQLHSLCK